MVENNLNHLNRCFNSALISVKSPLLLPGRRFAELARQSGELDLSNQIDEVVREIQGE